MPLQATAEGTPAAMPLPRWQRLDRRLFAWMGAGHQAHPLVLVVAKAVAHWSWVPLLSLMLTVVQGDGRGLLALGQCLLLAAVVQLASKRLSRHIASSRPFTEGLSPNHLNHSPRAGFPSTHATVMGAVFGFMLLHLPPSPALAGMAVVILATGWARVYAGAHFPLDVLAGLVVGGTAGAALAAAFMA